MQRNSWMKDEFSRTLQMNLKNQLGLAGVPSLVSSDAGQQSNMRLGHVSQWT